MDPKEIAKSLVRFRSNIKCFDMTYEILKREYPDEFVAIHNQEVVGHGRNFSQLVEYLNEEFINTSEVFIGRTYFEEEPPTLILRTA